MSDDISNHEAEGAMRYVGARQGETVHTPSLIDQAAYEIERLRAEVERLTREREQIFDDCAKRNAEHEAAETTLEDEQAAHQDTLRLLKTAEQNVEKMREVLTCYVKQDDAQGVLYPWTLEARAALAETEKE